MTDRAPAQLDAAAASRLRRLNVIIGSAHALQAVVLVAIATAASLPVTATFLIGPPGTGDYGSASLGSLRIDWLVGAFLLLAAVDHLTLSGGRPRCWYEANVARGINPARWGEYSVSASLMVVLIAMLAGVSELVALIALAGPQTPTPATTTSSFRPSSRRGSHPFWTTRAGATPSSHPTTGRSCAWWPT